MKDPLRNAVAVRFTDDELARVEAAALRANMLVSPWVRSVTNAEASKIVKPTKRLMAHG